MRKNIFFDNELCLGYKHRHKLLAICFTSFSSLFFVGWVEGGLIGKLRDDKCLVILQIFIISCLAQIPLFFKVISC